MGAPLCPVHPGYRALRPPTAECLACLRAWNERHPVQCPCGVFGVAGLEFEAHLVRCQEAGKPLTLPGALPPGQKPLWQWAAERAAWRRT